ncbi:hypothetical protein [Prochlorococcus marinus]|uniref:hypothetical protein n=1 Tax=Prochlorococcus marinus TaxID=1219 RepID=UPI0022B3C494|nr:hypothetical protein [Prochlorococcus marinus]
MTPITSGSRDRRQRPGIVTGAIAGAFGPDVVGDAYLISGQQNMISGQKKQTAVQEWTRWKQWALDHKDFNDFVDRSIEKANIHNERVEELLFTEEVQREIIAVLNQPKKKSKKRRVLVVANFLGGLFVIAAIILIISVIIYGMFL